MATNTDKIPCIYVIVLKCLTGMIDIFDKYLCMEKSNDKMKVLKRYLQFWKYHFINCRMYFDT